MIGLSINPFERARYLGSITQAGTSQIRVNFPFATEAAPAMYAGQRVSRGQVGEFVAVQGYGSIVLGRIIELRLPDRDRLSVEPEREADEEANPIATIRLLGSVDPISGRSTRGIPEPPRIGDHVYLAHPEFLAHAIDLTSSDGGELIGLGRLSGSNDTMVSLSPNAIFGKHCAVLGSTGGGKSWTTARLVEEISARGGKVLLLDPTGEYHSFGELADHFQLGGTHMEDDGRRFASFPHRHLSEGDLFALFQPSTQVQAPKLRDALMSLKLLAVDPTLGSDGLLIKKFELKKPINSALLLHDKEIRRPGAPFDISKLPLQIINECVWPTNNGQASSWGGIHDISMSSCVTLCMRIESTITLSALSPIFDPAPYMSDITGIIDDFVSRTCGPHILRVSLQYLPFENNTREIVVNAIGRHLLSRAREGAFQSTPLVVALDEAHQFLNKGVGDEFNRVSLDAFGLIAKEGRKYGLLCVLATQRPRDIPEDVLSQIGMFIVHRLINERDLAVVVNASGALDSSAASFLPNLRDGEAMIVGSHAIMPLPISVTAPTSRPHMPERNRNTWLYSR